ncbi:MAG: hypothetical protein ABII06_04715 [Pseudomonadota bacterium]
MGGTRITEAEITRILKLYDQGMNTSAIIAALGRSRAQVLKIIRESGRYNSRGRTCSPRLVSKDERAQLRELWTRHRALQPVQAALAGKMSRDRVRRELERMGLYRARTQRSFGGRLHRCGRPRKGIKLKDRVCLKCDRVFLSEGIFNRICPSCSNTNKAIYLMDIHDGGCLILESIPRPPRKTAP